MISHTQINRITSIFKSSCIIAFIFFGTHTKASNEYETSNTLRNAAKYESLLQPEVDKLCKNTNDSLCAPLQKACKESPGGKIAPNFCLIRLTLYTVHYGEKCGPEKILECAQEQQLYEIKLMEFGRDYASEPGPGRAAANMCTPFAGLSIKNAAAQNLLTSVNKIMPNEASLLVDSKVYYECVKEQYMKLIENLMKK